MKVQNAGGKLRQISLSFTNATRLISLILKKRLKNNQYRVHNKLLKVKIIIKWYEGDIR